MERVAGVQFAELVLAVVVTMHAVEYGRGCVEVGGHVEQVKFVDVGRLFWLVAEASA